MTTGLIPEMMLNIVNLYAPAGTRIPMNQAAPPLGWTTDSSAAMNDTSMRLNSTTGGAAGGSTAWSQWNFGGTFNTNVFTISVAQLPPHSHSDAGHGHSASSSDGGHQHGVPGGQFVVIGGGGGNGLAGGGQSFSFQSVTSTGNASISTSIGTGFANIQNTGSNAGIQPNYTTPQVKYTDHIMAVKS